MDAIKKLNDKIHVRNGQQHPLCSTSKLSFTNISNNLTHFDEDLKYIQYHLIE